ncbi:hypothetical protein bcgnr5372_45660 [Bacillus luti]|nr:hypothetical protein [Bacillus cereus]HDR8329658.1 hypothetical protein [Bacillus cereus]HDR8337040.1 hypothetical protein [Bacillus cereus]
MKYEVPKCDCGKYLFITTHTVNVVQFKISAIGKKYMKPWTTEFKENYTDLSEWLQCNTCLKRYELYTEKGKVFRGEELL